jgi:hypothetical protein
MPLTTLALDLEGTIIQDSQEPLPRPFLNVFLLFCKILFDRIVVIMTTVEEVRFRPIAQALVEQKSAPKWFLKLNIFDGKDLIKF